VQERNIKKIQKDIMTTSAFNATIATVVHIQDSQSPEEKSWQ
jgi:hypothetical protein